MTLMGTDSVWSKTRHDFDGYPILPQKKKLHNPAWPLVHNAEDIWHTKRWTQGEGSRECCLRLLDEWGAPLAGSAFREEFKRFAIESDLVWLAQMARPYVNIVYVGYVVSCQHWYCFWGACSRRNCLKHVWKFSLEGYKVTVGCRFTFAGAD